MTGDLELLDEKFRPLPLAINVPEAGITETAQAEARNTAFRILTQTCSSTRVRTAKRGTDVQNAIIEFLTGTSDPNYHALLREELNLDDADIRAPDWTRSAIAPGRSLQVVIIGAGMSGLLAGHRLAQAQVEFVIVEKNDDVGGTWLENHYPGCRVDNPNHVYSYSFAQRPDWPSFYSERAVLLEYFRTFAKETALTEHIRFQTEVVSATFDQTRCVWLLTLQDRKGRNTIEADAVLCAVGQLNRPLLPDIPGRQLFSGPAFHSARWDHSVNPAGKRVSVVGTGGSAAQFAPIVAAQASSCIIYQRSPNWFVPTPHYHDAVPPGLLWLWHHVPSSHRWYRAWQFWRTADGLRPSFVVDPTWPRRERSVSLANEVVRARLAQHIRDHLSDTPHLVDKVVPSFPPAAKRMILHNGAWLGTLRRNNVELVTTPIREITSSAVITEDGRERPTDIIIYGTGFQGSKFLSPLRVTGRRGVELNQLWDGDARAYLGITVPGFPNLFMLYGPNTNIVFNGTTVYFAECEVRYVLHCLRLLLDTKHRAMDCRRAVYDRYNEWLDDGTAQMPWGASRVRSWYRNEKGRIAQNWPFSLLEYWTRTRTVDASDYEFL